VLAVRSRTTRSSKGKASIILFFSTFLLITFPSFSSFFFDTLTPHPLHPPFSLSYYTCLPIPSLPSISSSRTQKATHNNSRNNSANSASTRPTQPATEIAFFVPSQISCLAQSLVTSSSERTSAIGSSPTASVMPPSSTTNVAWTSTSLSCVSLVSRPTLLFYCWSSSSARTRGFS